MNQSTLGLGFPLVRQDTVRGFPSVISMIGWKLFSMINGGSKRYAKYTSMLLLLTVLRFNVQK